MKTREKLYSTIIDTPLGFMRIEADDKSILSVSFSNEKSGEGENNLSKRGARALDNYFKGSREIEDLPIAPASTPFSAKVYEEIRKIPYGEVRSYSDIARAIGKPGASRAVGQALHRNRHLLLVPCPRVVAKSGIGGFNGGREIKECLLRLEREGHSE